MSIRRHIPACYRTGVLYPGVHVSLSREHNLLIDEVQMDLLEDDYFTYHEGITTSMGTDGLRSEPTKLTEDGREQNPHP